MYPFRSGIAAPSTRCAVAAPCGQSRSGPVDRWRPPAPSTTCYGSVSRQAGRSNDIQLGGRSRHDHERGRASPGHRARGLRAGRPRSHHAVRGARAGRRFDPRGRGGGRALPVRHDAGGPPRHGAPRRSGPDRAGRPAAGPHPVAAAAKLAQDVDISVGTTVAVLDFGGGSFEATVVRRTSDGFDVVGPPGGLADLGGVEIDDAVFARVDAALGHVLQTVAPDDAEGVAAVRRLRTACRAAKEQLSYSAETTVEVALPHLSTWVPITRAQLEDDIRPWLIAAVDVVARTITAAGLSLPDVHVALLVGGSSRIPLFGELVAARLGLPIVTDPFPELTVALGAALFGQDNPAPRAPSGPIEGDDVGAGDALRALAAWFADPGANPPAGAGVVPEATMPSGDLVGDPPARADPVADDQCADDAWDGWDEPLEDAEADLSATVSERPFAGPTTGETDLWGAPSRRGRRRAAQGGDGDDDASMDPPTDSDQGDGEGTSPRLVLALIGAALAVVGIAGAALAAGMGGSDDPGLTLVDPTRSAITTSTTTSTSTTTATAPTTTAEPPSTTTEPEDEYESEQPPPPPTEPPTTTTTAPPTTTAVPPTTTSTTTRSTTTMTNCPGPPTTPPPSTTSTT